MKFWRSEFTHEEITHVLDQIRPLRKFSPEGRVTLVSGDVEGWIAFLISASGFEVRTDKLRIRIVKSALFSSDLRENFTEKEFRSIVYRLRDKFQNKELRIFKVAFPIWNKPPFLAGVKKIDDVTINLSPSPRTRLFNAINDERVRQRSDRGFASFFTKERLAELEKCSTCVAHVKANSPGDASERACEAIYELLGLVNMARDAAKRWRWSSRIGGKFPVSDVLIGPHTTTHSNDGTITHDGFWHEAWVGGPTQTSRDQRRLKSWERRYEQLTNGISNSPWRKHCKVAAVRYFKAFSNPNLEESFLDGWRLFENVTGSRYEKIEQKIVRASNIFKADIEYRILGKHLALRRNLIAHGHPIKADDYETLAFQMLQFVLPYMERFILNGFGFTRPEEFWEFLDLPANKQERSAERDQLLRRLSLLDKAAQFRGESSGVE